jgi:hypothetical protein
VSAVRIPPATAVIIFAAFRVPQGLSSGDIEYEMMDAHLDELMQYVQ